MKNYLVIGNRWSLVGNEQLRKACDIRKALQLAGGNSGNLLIGQAVHRHLVRLEHDASIQYCRMSDMDAMQTEDVRSYYDALIIPASNMINKSVNWGGLANFIERVGLPLVIIGMGAEAGLFADDIVIPEGSVRFLNVAAAHSASIGVRGEYTASFLEKMGIHNVEIIGCPSFYWFGSKGFQLKPVAPTESADVLKLSVSVTRDRKVYGFTENLKTVHRQLLNHVIDNHGSYIVQSNFAEASMSYHQEIQENNLSNMMQYFGLAREKLEPFVTEGIHIFFNTSEWQAHLANFGATVGSRFHGNMMSLVGGTPALWITHDVRTRELCEHLGVSHLHVDEIVANGMSVNDMVNAIDYSDFASNYSARYETYLSFMRKNNLALDY